MSETSDLYPSSATERAWPERLRTSGVLSETWVPFWLTLIVLLAAFLRFSGLDWDRHIHHHPDERFLTDVVANIGWPQSLGEYLDEAESPLNPRNVPTGEPPNQGQKFPLWVYGDFALTLVKGTTVLLDNIDPLPSGMSWSNYDQNYMVGRVLNGLADIGTLVLLFFIAWRLYKNHWLALCAALLYSLTVLPIQHSHYWVVDNLATFFATGTIFWLVRALDDEGLGRLSDYLLGGLFFGMALATKVSIATLAVPFAALGALKLWQASRQPDADLPQVLSALILRLGGAAIVTILVFRVLQPYAFVGLFTPAERWLANLREVQCQINGTCDPPWGFQWTNRTEYLFPWKNMVLWGMGLPLGLAAWAGWGVAGWQLIRRQRWMHLLPVVWVLGLFLHQGGQWVMSMRYLLPIYPMLVLLGTWLLFWLWRRAERPAAATWQRPAAALLAAGVLVGTALYAFAFTNVYRNPHTHVQAAEWLYENVPEGASIGLEHFDEYLPVHWPGSPPAPVYDRFDLLWYNPDSPQKLDDALAWLDRADYIVTVSNRLYGSTARLPARFPLTGNYYKALFSGELGFERVADFTEGPTLFGIELDDQFDRSGPGWLGVDWDDWLAAEEAFTVYDHPRVQVFRKTDAYDTEQARAILTEGVDWGNISTLTALEWTRESRNPPATPMLTEAERQSYRQGGTWSALFDRSSLTNRLPLPVWILWVELLGLLALPWLVAVAHRTPGRLYALAKPLGLLLVGWLSWLLGSLKLVPFTVGGILLAMGLVGVGSLLLGLRLRRRRSLRAWLRRDGGALLRAELVFWLFFALVLLVRWANPDIWHPVMGGERPMDFAYLNATIKSTYFPPMDPWFAGGYINYYYFGFVLVALLVKVSGIVPAVAYNLVVPTLFAMLAAGVWAVALALMPRRSPNRGRIAALAAIFVAVIGNLGELKVVLEGLAGLSQTTFRNGIPGLETAVRAADGLLRGVILGGQQLAGRPEWPYWNATRVIESAQINEFPWFTYLYADLHAHMMALPFTVLALGLAVAFLHVRRDGRSRLEEALHLGLIALVIGSLWPLNTWDFPTYALVAFAGLGLREWHRAGRITLDGVLNTAWRWLLVLVVGRLLFQPFHTRYGAAYTSVERWTGPLTTLEEFVTVHGFFLWVLAFTLLSDLLFGLGHNRAVERVRGALRGGRVGTTTERLSPGAMVALGLAALAVAGALLLMATWSAPVGLSLLLLVLALLLFFRERPQPLWQMALFMIILGLGLVIAVEVVVLTGDVGRMNSVFKFYLQVWVLWGIAAALGIAHVVAHWPRWAWPLQVIWRGSVAALLAITLLYPIFSTYAKINDRFDRAVGRTLDGAAFMETAVYNGPQGPIPLRHDAEAIRWMQENLTGSPVVAEISAGLYTPTSRITMYTGNPTIVGWDWHQRQQRAALQPGAVEQRIADVTLLYSTPDPALAHDILTLYGAEYVVVGAWERAHAPPEGIDKFAAFDGQIWQLVFQNEGTQVYQVLTRDGASAGR